MKPFTLIVRNLEHLETVELGASAAPTCARFTAVPDNAKGYFTSLETLYVEMTFSQANFPKTLTFLTLRSALYKGDTIESYGWIRFLEIIGSQLCHLRQLHSNLRYLTLEAQRCIDLEQNQLVTVLQAFPYLESLEIPRSTPVDLSCLAAIVPRPVSHNLQVLELNRYTPRITALPDVDIPLSQLKSFLGPLRAELSLLQIAEFLEDVLPPECRLPRECGLVYDTRAAFARVWEKDRKRQTRGYAAFEA